MEARRWKLLHHSAQKALKQTLPSPLKEKFRSSKEKNQQVFTDSSNKLLNYANSYLDKQNLVNKSKNIRNKRESQPQLLSQDKKPLISQYFQNNDRKVSLQNTVNWRLSKEQLYHNINNAISHPERKDKSKTLFSATTNCSENFGGETTKLGFVKSTSHRVSQSGSQMKKMQNNGFQQYYSKN